jgi:hypothetical protein
MSARHHITDSDPEAWGGLGRETAPNPKCARPECEKHARKNLSDLEDYCSNACARAHLGTCRGFTCNRIALPKEFGHPDFCSRICVQDRYDEDGRDD